MSNTDRHPECHMRTALGNCDPIGGFCTSVNESICEALHKVSRPRGEWIEDYNNVYSRCRMKCSACGKFSGIGLIESKYRKPYCPNCGARMFDKDTNVPNKIESDQRDYDITYEPTYNEQDGSM